MARAGGLRPSLISTTAALTPSCDVPDIRPIASSGPAAALIEIVPFACILTFPAAAAQLEHLRARRYQPPSGGKLERTPVAARVRLNGQLFPLLPLDRE